MTRSTWLVFASTILMMALGACPMAVGQESGTATVEEGEIKLSDLVQRVKGGDIDWGKQMMYATGEGVVPDPEKVPNRAIALLKAKDYAKMAAVANLLMVVEGTTVSYDGNGKEFMSRDAELKQRIEGYVRNVAILKTETVEVGDQKVVRVTVGTRMYGSETPGGALMDKLADTEKPKQPPLIQIPLDKSGPAPSKPREQAAAEEDAARLARRIGPASARPVDVESLPVEFSQEGPFTSLIVDARGYNVPQALSPKIRDLKGNQIYGSVKEKSELALIDGLVAYARTPESARRSERCGRNPLLVPAIGRGGGRAMCDVIVSDEVASLIKSENERAGFLSQYRVIFVVDPPGSALGMASAK
jgi:hypothetical protein